MSATTNGTVSGKATMGTVTDVAPLLRSMLTEMKRQEGKTEDVSDDEVRAAAQAFGAELDGNGADAAEEVRETIERSLPTGVRVENISAKREGTQVTSTTTFAFDDIRALPALELFYERGAKSHRPFAHLKLREESDGAALVVDGMPPAFETPLENVPDAELKKSAITLELDVQLPVAEHNATRADGSKLVWEIDALRMRSRKSDDAGWIHVKYTR